MNNEYTDLFTKISEMVPRIPGWCSISKAQTLAAIIMVRRPTLVLELGIFAGRSLIPMALAAKAVGNVRVIGVDPWRSDASVQGQTEDHQKWWGQQILHDNAKGVFESWVAGLGLHDVVETHQMTSDDYSTLLRQEGNKYGLLHVDGNHSQQAIKDVLNFACRMNAGSFCVMDDLQWDNGGPAAAVETLESMGFENRFVVQRETAEEKDDYGVWQKN